MDYLPVAMLFLCASLALTLLAVVMVLAFLVKTLALKAVDMSENRQLSEVVNSRQASRREEIPDVFTDDEDAPTTRPIPRGTAKKPEDMWRPAKPGERIGN